MRHRTTSSRFEIGEGIVASLRAHPVVNSQLDGENIVYKGDINTWGIVFNTPPELKGKTNLVPEMNDGQFKTVLRDQFLVDAKPVNKVSGHPFKIAEIEDAIEEALA